MNRSARRRSQVRQTPWKEMWLADQPSRLQGRPGPWKSVRGVGAGQCQLSGCSLGQHVHLSAQVSADRSSAACSNRLRCRFDGFASSTTRRLDGQAPISSRHLICPDFWVRVTWLHPDEALEPTKSVVRLPPQDTLSQLPGGVQVCTTSAAEDSRGCILAP